MEKTKKNKADIVKSLPKVGEDKKEYSCSSIRWTGISMQRILSAKDYKYLFVGENDVFKFSPTNGILATFQEILKTDKLYEIPVFVPGVGFCFLICGGLFDCNLRNKLATYYVQTGGVPVCGDFILCGISKRLNIGFDDVFSRNVSEFNPKHVRPFSSKVLKKLFDYFDDAFEYECYQDFWFARMEDDEE